MIDLKAKMQAVADMIEGRVVTQAGHVAICIKGSVMGFPASLQAISPSWPFGVTYLLETEVIEDPNRMPSEEILKLVLYPRLGRGLVGFFTHVFLFEAKGMSVRDKALESRFVFQYNNDTLAERFVKYPGISDKLVKLEQYVKFSEMTVKTDAGLFLSQPKSFNALDLDLCRATFKNMAEIGQVIFEAF